MGNQYKKDTRIIITVRTKILRYWSLLELSDCVKYQANAKKLKIEAV